MNDFEKIELAFDMLEDAEVMQEFDDCVWVKIDREMWEQFNASDEEDDDDEVTGGSTSS